jgi:peptidoglycan/LPS O-acetylase OafA/YrhL
MTQRPPQAGDYMPQLDGLRALAASAVLVEHFAPAGPRLPFSAAKAGVWLFFVLSGYLVTGILDRARDAAGPSPERLRRVWVSFFMRRMLRIWPLYYATVVGVALLGLPDARRFFPWAAAHLANAGIFYDLAAHGRLNLALPHFWSLGVEEQFYLAWPLVVLFAPRGWRLPVAAAGVLVAPASRLLLVVATKSTLAAESVPASCLDGLGLGAVLALTERRPGPWRPRLLRGCLGLGLALWAAVVAAGLAGVSGNRTFVVDRLAFGLTAAWVVGRASAGFNGPAGRLLALPPLAYLGRISYGIYALHFPVDQTLHLAEQTFGVPVHAPFGHWLLQCAYLYGMTVLCASASWWLLERPINALKRHFPYPRPPRPAPAAPAARVAAAVGL